MEEAFTVALLFKVTHGLALYWAFNGFDITDGEMMAVPADNPDGAFTIGQQGLTTRSSALLYKILKTRTDPDQWPQSVQRIIG